MTETMYKYPSIGSFKNVNKYVKYVTENANVRKPVISFVGTVKMHGTNAGVLVKSNGEVSAQSRNNPLTVINDNFGFAMFVEERADIYRKYYRQDGIDVVVNGEWIGKGIQAGVALSELPDRKHVVFDISVIDGEFKRFDNSLIVSDENDVSDSNAHNIYTTHQFPIFNKTIDFDDAIGTNKVIESMIAITDEVERECPVGKFFGISNTGEGVVWKPLNVPTKFARNDLYFKVKGETHAVTNTRKTNTRKTITIDTEELESITEFITYAVTENRIKQAIHELGVDIDSVDGKKLTGKVIKWVIEDVIKEELDTMIENKIDPKLLGKYAPNAIRRIFFRQIDL